MNMAASTVQPSPSVPESLLAASRSLALSLVWGGCLLVILGLWLGIKHEDLSRLWVGAVWLLAALSLGCGIWQYLTLGGPAASAEEKQAHLAQQRKVLGMVVSAGGVALVALGLFIGASFRLAAFGEVVGMCLLGLCAVAWGLHLVRAGRADRTEGHPIFELLRRQHAPIGLAMTCVGILL